MAADDSSEAANNKGMEARIELEMRGKKPAEITDLLLDNCKATKISGLTGEFSKLSTLSLINVGLTSLEGLPKLESLTTIDLSDNKLTGDLDKLADNCPQLYHINLCANKIKDVDSLAPLKKLKQLSALDLFDCEVTEVENYRQKVFELIPQLKYLDGFDINDVEHDEIDDDEEEEEDSEDGLDDEEEEEPEPSDEEEGLDDETGEEDDSGLAYLNSSKVQDEDESEDFVINGDAKKPATKSEIFSNNNNHKPAGEPTSSPTTTEANNRGTKRKHDGKGDDYEQHQPEEAK